MLKITRDATGAAQRWTLCGRLTGPWVSELRKTWEENHAESNGQVSIVDLSQVTAIDERGEDLLRLMKETGARFLTRGVAMKHILHHLSSKGKRPLRRCLSHWNDCI